MSLFDEMRAMSYNFVLVGDGSGVNAEGGWCVFMLRPTKGEVCTLSGSVSHATNNIMELEGYIVAMQEMLKLEIPAPTILICTDSDYVVKCGSGQHRRKANGHWWAAFDYLVDLLGAEVTFLHMDRNSWPWAVATHDLANEMREHVKDFLETHEGDWRDGLGIDPPEDSPADD